MSNIALLGRPAQRSPTMKLFPPDTPLEILAIAFLRVWTAAAAVSLAAWPFSTISTGIAWSAGRQDMLPNPHTAVFVCHVAARQKVAGEEQGTSPPNRARISRQAAADSTKCVSREAAARSVSCGRRAACRLGRGGWDFSGPRWTFTVSSRLAAVVGWCTPPARGETDDFVPVAHRSALWHAR